MKIGQADNRLAIKLLGCMNLLIKYTAADSEICGQYLQYFLVPILKVDTVSP